MLGLFSVSNLSIVLEFEDPDNFELTFINFEDGFMRGFIVVTTDTVSSISSIDVGLTKTKISFRNHTILLIKIFQECEEFLFVFPIKIGLYSLPAAFDLKSNRTL